MKNKQLSDSKCTNGALINLKASPSYTPTHQESQAWTHRQTHDKRECARARERKRKINEREREKTEKSARRKGQGEWERQRLPNRDQARVEWRVHQRVWCERETRSLCVCLTHKLIRDSVPASHISWYVTQRDRECTDKQLQGFWKCHFAASLAS